MGASSPLFRRYIDKFTIGELPKIENVAVDATPERMQELGYVKIGNEWAHHGECVRLLRNGKFTWVRMG